MKGSKSGARHDSCDRDTPARLSLTVLTSARLWSPDGTAIVATRGAGATAHGRTVASNLFYSFVRVPAAGGPATFEPRRNENDDYTEIASIALDGTDRRVHLVLDDADEAAVSPNGRWLAFQEGNNVYVTPFPMTGTTSNQSNFIRTQLLLRHWFERHSRPARTTTTSQQ